MSVLSLQWVINWSLKTLFTCYRPRFRAPINRVIKTFGSFTERSKWKLQNSDVCSLKVLSHRMRCVAVRRRAVRCGTTRCRTALQRYAVNTAWTNLIPEYTCSLLYRRASVDLPCFAFSAMLLASTAFRTKQLWTSLLQSQLFQMFNTFFVFEKKNTF